MVLPATARSIFTGLDELRNFLQVSIYPTYGADVSARQIIRDMREIGLGYNNQQMNDDIRFVKGLVKYEGLLRSYDPGGIVPKAWMQEVPYKLANQGQYRFMSTMYDPDEEKLVYELRALSSNKWYTKEEAEEEMENRLFGPSPDYPMRLLGVDLIEVWIKEGAELTR